MQDLVRYDRFSNRYLHRACSFDRHLRRPTDHIGRQLASTQNRVRYDQVSGDHLRNTWSFDRVSPCLSGHIDLQLASMQVKGRYGRFQLTAFIFCCGSVQNIEKCTMTQRDSHRPEKPGTTLATFYQVTIQAVLLYREICSLILQPECTEPGFLTTGRIFLESATAVAVKKTNRARQNKRQARMRLSDKGFGCSVQKFNGTQNHPVELRPIRQ